MNRTKRFNPVQLGPWPPFYTWLYLLAYPKILRSAHESFASLPASKALWQIHGEREIFKVDTMHNHRFRPFRPAAGQLRKEVFTMYDPVDLLDHCHARADDDTIACPSREGRSAAC